MQEMKANNLFGDESPTTATPCITEISLRDLCVDFDALKSQNTEYEIPEEDEESCSEEDNDSDIDIRTSFYLSEPVNQPRSDRSSLTSRKRSSDASSAKRTISSASSIKSKRTSNVSQDNIPEIHVNSDNIINEYNEMFPKNLKEPLPNGNLHFANNYTIRDCRPLYDDTNEEEMSLLRHNLHKSPSMPSKNRYEYNNRKKRKSWQETSMDDSDIARKSFQDVSVDSSDITYDDITKDDLLLMWKASEMELNDRLQKALREKSRLQRLLVDLDTSQEPTPV